jgi:hypothetical protein
MISKLDFDIMLPGHGAPVIGNASGKVRKMVMDILNPVEAGRMALAVKH